MLICTSHTYSTDPIEYYQISSIENPYNGMMFAHSVEKKHAAGKWRSYVHNEGKFADFSRPMSFYTKAQKGIVRVTDRQILVVSCELEVQVNTRIVVILKNGELRSRGRNVHDLREK